MGLQTTKTDNGASVLVIDQPCDNDQLLVSLCKNDSHWLSPVGWTDQQKVTLLDCYANGAITEIDIPAEFAKDIISGDVLVLRCSELDLEKEIIWEQSEIEERNMADVTPAPVSLASGLLSRFKSSKPEVKEAVKSDAQVRAEEADRAAKSFKAKMDAATEAKERAQKKAFEAAREAEAALKMEAERIAEMERAAKAFEEAERLKQDENRRVEEERRAEEARLAEEARKLEEARLHEIAARKETERLAALERYEAALDITRDEELRLKEHLKSLKDKAKIEAANADVQSDDLESRRGFLVVTEETAKKRNKSFQDSALKLEGITAQLASIQSESDTFTAEREAVLTKLAQADTDYQDAQQKAEAAIALAQQRRAQLDTIRAEDGNLSLRIAELTETLSAKSLSKDDLTHKTQKLLEKSEVAQTELEQAKIEIDAIEKNLQAQAEITQTLRLEIEATQQAIEDSQAREIAHRGAIDHLTLGGAPEDIADIDNETRDYTPLFKKTETAQVNLGGSINGGFMNRVRSKFVREKDAKISIALDDASFDETSAKFNPVLMSGVDQSPTVLRRHSSSLIALGAVIGGIALLGGGLAINKSASSTLEVKSTTVLPTQVASAIAAAPKIKVSKKTVIESEIDISEPRVLPMLLGAVDTDTPQVAQETEISIPEVTQVVETKLAEVVDPVGFAFELPDMMPTANQSKDSEVRKTKASLEAALLKKTPKKTLEAIVETKAPLKAPKPPITEKKDTKKTVNYPELTKDVQARLKGLGFYTGDIDGLQGGATIEAIRTFKELFSLPVNDDITGSLLTELKRAEREQEVARLLLQAQVKEIVQPKTQVAAAPTIEVYDTVAAFPTTPVLTDTLTAVEPQAEQVNITPYVVSTPQPELEPKFVPEPRPVKVASLPTIPEPAPVIEDVITKASLIKNAGASYPFAAERRGYLVNVSIVVSYDIDETGKAQNLSVASNDHSGRYNDAFEREAFKAIEKLRYKPRTVNGVATKAIGKEKRIVFRAE